VNVAAAELGGRLWSSPAATTDGAGLGPGHRHPVGDPLTGPSGPVNAVLPQTRQGLIADSFPIYVGGGTRNVVIISPIFLETDSNLRREQIVAPGVAVIFLRWHWRLGGLLLSPLNLES
jgi:hypothetical protein